MKSAKFSAIIGSLFLAGMFTLAAFAVINSGIPASPVLQSCMYAGK